MSKLNETTSGRSVTLCMPSTAHTASSTAKIVSTTSRSTPPSASALRLLGVRRDGILAVQEPVGLDQLAGRPERPGDEPIGAGALPGELGSAEVHLAGPARRAAPR